MKNGTPRSPVCGNAYINHNYFCTVLYHKFSERTDVKLLKRIFINKYSLLLQILSFHIFLPGGKVALCGKWR